MNVFKFLKYYQNINQVNFSNPKIYDHFQNIFNCKPKNFDYDTYLQWNILANVFC